MFRKNQRFLSALYLRRTGIFKKACLFLFANKSLHVLRLCLPLLFYSRRLRCCVCVCTCVIFYIYVTLGCFWDGIYYSYDSYELIWLHNFPWNWLFISSLSRSKITQWTCLCQTTRFWLCAHITLPVLSIAIGMAFPKADSNVSAKCIDIILSMGCTTFFLNKKARWDQSKVIARPTSIDWRAIANN